METQSQFEAKNAPKDIDTKKESHKSVHSSPVLSEGLEQLAAKKLENKLKSIPLRSVNKNKINTQKTTDDDNYWFLSQAGDRARAKEVFEGKKVSKEKSSPKKLSQRPEVSIFFIFLISLCLIFDISKADVFK